MIPFVELHSSIYADFGGDIMATVASNEPVKQIDLKGVKTGPLIAVLLSGAFVAILSETILNVALSAIMDNFNIASGTAQWLVTGYMLVIGTIVPISAYFMRRFSTRQLFITAMTFFTLGTLIAGFSPTFSILLIGRLTQALGTAIILPLLTNTILAVVPIERRGAAMGLMGLIIMFAPAIGPTFSGLIVESLTWRWLFYFTFPIAAVSLLFGMKVLVNVTETSKPKLDILSFILSTLGFGGIVYGFSSAGKGDASFTDPLVVTTLLIGLISLILFYWRQLNLEKPLLDVRVLRYPMFSLGLLITMLTMMTMFAMMLVLPMYLQSAILLTAVTTGLVMLPGGLINGAISPLMGRLFDKWGPRPLLIPGTIIMAITVFMYRFALPGVPTAVFIILQAVLMIAVAMIMMPAQTNGLNQIPERLYPHGTAIFNTLMQISGAIGAALFISVMESGQQNYLNNSGISNPSPQESIDALKYGSQQSFTTGLILAIASIIIALFIRNSKKAKNIG